jgi:type IV pilus assembly protein PilE
MNKSRGFTLIELMITVAIVGILAAIAYPSFLAQIRKSRRVEAQSTLMSIAAKQQQMLLDVRSYAADTATLNLTPPDSVTKNYTVSMVVSTSTVPAFTATAAPLGGQAADTCGTLSLTDAGVKSPASCW